MPRLIRYIAYGAAFAALPVAAAVLGFRTLTGCAHPEPLAPLAAERLAARAALAAGKARLHTEALRAREEVEQRVEARANALHEAHADRAALRLQLASAEEAE